MHMFWQTVDMAHYVLVWAVSELVFLTYQCPVPPWHIMKIITYQIGFICYLEVHVSWLFNHSNYRFGKRYWHTKVLDLIADLLKCAVLDCLQFVLNVLDSPYQGHLANACKNILPCEGLTFLQVSQIYVLVCQQVWFDKHCNSL